MFTEPKPLVASAPVSFRQRILIVEDDPEIAEFLHDNLREQGFATSGASSGEEVLNRVATERPSLIVMDVRLPGIDGMTVCELLADQAETCHIPVILVSGLECSDVVRHSRKCGARYFLHKPYDPNVLLILIESALLEAKRWQAE